MSAFTIVKSLKKTLKYQTIPFIKFTTISNYFKINFMFCCKNIDAFISNLKEMFENFNITIALSLK